MYMLLRRETYTDRSTIGNLFINDEWFCYTLEDVDRHLETIGGQGKIYGQTAIPRGIYKVIIDWSDRHGEYMPHIMDVPYFTGIRFDIANTPEELLGCVAVGYSFNVDWVGQSRKAWNALMDRLSVTIGKGEDVWLEVE